MVESHAHDLASQSFFFMGKLGFMSWIISDSVECRSMYVAEDVSGKSPSFSCNINIITFTCKRNITISFIYR